MCFLFTTEAYQKRIFYFALVSENVRLKVYTIQSLHDNVSQFLIKKCVFFVECIIVCNYLFKYIFFTNY